MRISNFCLILSMLATVCGCSPTSDKASDQITENSVRTETDKADIDPWKADSIAYLNWGSPASPRRDEERYIRFLNSLLASDSLPEALRERAEYRRRMAMLNRRGTTAADFRYRERHGGVSRLHELRSPLTLLIFYDPECPHCNEILRQLANSEAINRAIAEKNLTVIAIYAEGKRDVWEKNLNEMPDNWLVGFDLSGIVDNEIYSLPAMPIPYLLDSNKQVLLKDPQIRTLIGIISQM